MKRYLMKKNKGQNESHGNERESITIIKAKYLSVLYIEYSLQKEKYYYVFYAW